MAHTNENLDIILQNKKVITLLCLLIILPFIVLLFSTNLPLLAELEYIFNIYDITIFDLFLVTIMLILVPTGLLSFILYQTKKNPNINYLQILFMSSIMFPIFYMILINWQILIFAVCLIFIFGGFLLFISIGFINLNYGSNKELKNWRIKRNEY